MQRLLACLLTLVLVQNGNTKHVEHIDVSLGVDFDVHLLQQLVPQHMESIDTYLTDSLRDLETLTEAYFFFAKMHIGLRIHMHTKYLKNNSEIIETREHIDHFLDTYCEWQHAKKVAQNGYWLSVLFTGLDVAAMILHDNHKSNIAPFPVPAYGHPNSYCDRTRSCVIIKYETATQAAFLLARSIAFSLGVTIDTHKKCDKSSEIHSIPRTMPLDNVIVWSECEGLSVQAFLQSKAAHCLTGTKNVAIKEIEYTINK